MTADALRRSPLHDRAAALAEFSATGDVTLAEMPFTGMLNLRVLPGAASAAQNVLEAPLPHPLRAVTVDDVSVLWLGPDEFMVIAPASDPAGLAGQLNTAIQPGTGSVVDVSANRTILELGGPNARDVLEKGIAIDLNQAPGWCAQTLLTSVPIILWRMDDERWRILVRPSFANYVADWLIDATTEHLG